MSTRTTRPPKALPALPPGRRPARLTVEKYEAMIASGLFTKRDRFELIEGILVEKMTKKPPHSVSSELTRVALDRACPVGWHVRIEKPVRIPRRRSMPEPDVSVARGKITDYGKRDPGPDDVALVVEVSHTTVKAATRFAGTPAMTATYGGGSIPVYWLVNIPERQLEVYTEPSGPASPAGYRRCQILLPGQDVPLLIEGREVARIAVADLLPPVEEG